jgi:hypothetical protein
LDAVSHQLADGFDAGVGNPAHERIQEAATARGDVEVALKHRNRILIIGLVCHRTRRPVAADYESNRRRTSLKWKLPPHAFAAFLAAPAGIAESP